MNKTNLFLSDIFGFIKNHWAIIISVSTSVLYIIGYISAKVYYSYWNIPFQEIGNSLAPFEFLLQKPSMLFYTLLVVLIVIIQIKNIDWYEDRTVKKLFKERVIEGFKRFSLVMFPIFLVVFIILIMSPQSLQNQIRQKEYIPFHVGTSDPEANYKCVYILGNLSGFLIVVSEGLQPIILKQDNIAFIKAMMQPFPTKEIAYGKGSMINQNYEAEKKIWNTHWNTACINSTSYEFKTFDFNRIRPKG